MSFSIFLAVVFALPANQSTHSKICNKATITGYLNYFQVLLQGNERLMGVGVVWKDYGTRDMPGRRQDTVGYIVNQGKVFGPCYPTNLETGREYESE